MPKSDSRGVRIAGVIIYGLAAGFAVTTVIVLGQILSAFFGTWIFHQLGWEQASMTAARFGFYYVYSIPLGLIVGAVVCLRVWTAGFRKLSTPISFDAK